MSVLPVPKSDLGQLDFISEGKFGKVYRTAYKIHSADPAELVYKEYKPSASASVRARSAARAERAVQFRDDLFLNKGDRAILDMYFAWPREVVQDDVSGEICGFLMPLAPREYFWQLWRLDEGRYANVPRTLDWVTTTEKLWALNRVDLSDVTATDRLFLMAQLVYAIGWLHKRNWVFGDLSFTNVAFAMYPDPPRPLIFDCDDAVDLADPRPGEQPHSPFWVPPECRASPPAPQDQVTDVYKLGLAIVRCLKPGDGTAFTNDVSRLADILDDEGMKLLTRALSVNRDERPTAKELFTYLARIATSRMVPPVIAHAEVVSPLLPPGGNARLYWQIEGAEEINVYFGDNPREHVRTVTPADPPGECAFPVTRSGQVTVEAKNRYGTTPRVIGDVALFEIPQFSFDPLELPRPDVPPVPDYTAAPFPDLPAGHPDPPDVPSVPEPAFAKVFRELSPGTSLTSPGQHINALLDTSRSLLDMLLAENERFTVRLRSRRERFTARLRRMKMGNGNGQALPAGAPWRRGPQTAGG
jgi:hypothetical protein